MDLVDHDTHDETPGDSGVSSSRTLVACVLVALALGRFGLTSRPASWEDGTLDKLRRVAPELLQGPSESEPQRQCRPPQHRHSDAQAAIPKRPYSDPTEAWVVGALSEGAADPAELVDEGWTPEQKWKWSAQFSTILAGLRRRAGEQREADVQRSADALGVSLGVPIVRDVAEGLVQATGGLASIALRALESTLAEPAAGQEKLSDTLSRALEERERVCAIAGQGGAMGWLRWLARSPLFLPGLVLSLHLVARARQAVRCGHEACPADPARSGRLPVHAEGPPKQRLLQCADCRADVLVPWDWKGQACRRCLVASSGREGQRRG